MDAIKYLLSFLFKFAILLFFSAIVWWLVVNLFPGLSLRSMFSLNATSTQGSGWLPAPGSLKGLFGQPKVNDGSNVYVPGEAFDGYSNAFNGNRGGAQVDFVTYTTEGTEIIRGGNNSVFNGQQEFLASKKVDSSGYSQKNLYIRNLSIYEGGHAYTGLSFIGEARNTMFQNGKFPIIIVNNVGQIVSVSYAEATSNWTVPGWTKFQVRVESVLPNKVPCTMVFEEARGTYTYQTTPPVRVAIPLMCN